MTARMILRVFETYQTARSIFAQAVADLASRACNVDCLISAGAIGLLKPLLGDPVPSIQQGAAVALGRMAGHEERVAEMLVQADVLPLLLQDLEKQSKYYKRAALFILRAICKHGPEMADIVIRSGGLDAMTICLEDFDGGVKESALWGVVSIARHTEEQAQAVVDAGAVPLLVLCVQEPELTLKRAAVCALIEVAKHTVELAMIVVDAGAIPYLAKSLSNIDPKLKRQILTCLSHIAKHSVDLAEVIVEAEVFPEVLVHLAHPDDEVKRAAATLTREVVKHTLELAQLVVNTGGIAALLEMIAETVGSLRLPAIMCIGYICAHSDQLALAVINGKGMLIMAEVLCDEKEDHILAASVWAVGQCGKHSPEHAGCVGACEVLPRILQLYTCEKSSEDLRCKAKCALKQILIKSLYIPALEPLLEDCPPNILKYVVGQFSKILPNDPRARRFFVSSGALRKMQEIEAEPGSTLMEYITIINCCFPEEVVQYYSPGYPDVLLDRVEQYQPQINPLLVCSPKSSEEDAMQRICQDLEEMKDAPL